MLLLVPAVEFLFSSCDGIGECQKLILGHNGLLPIARHRLSSAEISAGYSELIEIIYRSIDRADRALIVGDRRSSPG
jgi:hypothetical protein